MKWPWEKFGFRVREAESEHAPVASQPNSQLILKLLQIETSPHAQIHFYELVGRAVAVVSPEDCKVALQGQNIFMASRESGWDVVVLTSDEFNEHKEAARRQFTSINGVDSTLAELLIDRGCFTFGDLSVMEPATLMILAHVDLASALAIIAEADARLLATDL